MRLIVKPPAGTGRLILASNEGSTGTRAMPHLYVTVGRAGKLARAFAIVSKRARALAVASGDACGEDGFEGDCGANSLENSGDG
jgi:hypothetical protein